MILSSLIQLSNAVLLHFQAHSKRSMMKISGDIEIVNRLLSSTGVRSRGRCSRAQLSIGHTGPAGNKVAALLICKQQDRSGTKYAVSVNSVLLTEFKLFFV